MTAVLAGLAALAALLVLGRVTSRGRAGAPRLRAAAWLVVLCGWALVPAVWVACTAGLVGAWLGGRTAGDAGCLLGVDASGWTLIADALGVSLLSVVVWHGWRAAGAARRLERRARRVPPIRVVRTSLGAVTVLPSDRPAAFALGVLRPRAVVTTGLLERLGALGAQAVCEHEAAHLRLGHPRLLLLGRAIAAAYHGFWPVERAWDGLRAAFEAAADDAASAVVGRPALQAALVTLQAEVSAGGIQVDLGARCARLEGLAPCRGVSGPLAGLLVVTIGLIALGSCALVGAPSSGLGIVGCSLLLVGLAAREAVSLRRHSEHAYP